MNTELSTHGIALLLAELFGDTCACNYNGIDEWLPEKCEFANTSCPNPGGVACWEQFLKYKKIYPKSTVPLVFVTKDGVLHPGFFLKDANKYLRNINRWKDTESGKWFDDEEVVGWM